MGREPEWTRRSCSGSSLAHAIDEHIQITEQTEGLYDEISAKAPHLATKIDALREEHPVLRERATALITRLQTTPIGPACRCARPGRPPAAARSDRAPSPARIDLVWEAYNLDIGGIEQLPPRLG